MTDSAAQKKEYDRLEKLGRGILPSLRIDQVQELLSISRRSVYRLIERREVSVFKVGNSLRITHQSVIDYQQRKIQEYIENEYE